MIKKVLALPDDFEPQDEVIPIENPVINPAEGTYEGVSGNVFGSFIARLWWTIVMIGGIALLIFLIWGGIDWLTSAGDQEKLKNARNKITHALVGMGILAGSYAIISILHNVFGFDVLKFDWPEAPTTP